jgi:hypothetical protein
MNEEFISHLTKWGFIKQSDNLYINFQNQKLRYTCTSQKNGKILICDKFSLIVYAGTVNEIINWFTIVNRDDKIHLITKLS